MWGRPWSISVPRRRDRHRSPLRRNRPGRPLRGPLRVPLHRLIRREFLSCWTRPAGDYPSPAADRWRRPPGSSCRPVQRPGPAIRLRSFRRPPGHLPVVFALVCGEDAFPHPLPRSPRPVRHRRWLRLNRKPLRQRVALRGGETRRRRDRPRRRADRPRRSRLRGLLHRYRYPSHLDLDVADVDDAVCDRCPARKHRPRSSLPSLVQHPKQHPRRRCR